MGRGDSRTTKGKIKKGSYGISRLARPAKSAVVATAEEPAPKKTKAKKAE